MVDPITGVIMVLGGSFLTLGAIGPSYKQTTKPLNDAIDRKFRSTFNPRDDKGNLRGEPALDYFWDNIRKGVGYTRKGVGYVVGYIGNLFKKGEKESQTTPEQPKSGGPLQSFPYRHTPNIPLPLTEEERNYREAIEEMKTRIRGDIGLIGRPYRWRRLEKEIERKSMQYATDILRERINSAVNNEELVKQRRDTQRVLREQRGTLVHLIEQKNVEIGDADLLYHRLTSQQNALYQLIDGLYSVVDEISKQDGTRSVETIRALADHLAPLRGLVDPDILPESVRDYINNGAGYVRAYLDGNKPRVRTFLRQKPDNVKSLYQNHVNEQNTVRSRLHEELTELTQRLNELDEEVANIDQLIVNFASAQYAIRLQSRELRVLKIKREYDLWDEEYQRRFKLREIISQHLRKMQDARTSLESAGQRNYLEGLIPEQLVEQQKTEA